MDSFLFGNSPITSFSGKYRWLSNFWISPIKTADGKVWPSAEHLYQAYKTKSRRHRKEILQCGHPSNAKKLGRRIPIRDDWDTIKIDIMKKVVYLKFTQNIELQRKLKETGDVDLVEGNYWHDNIWGDCMCNRCKSIKGLNYLGNILMDVRSHIGDSNE